MDLLCRFRPQTTFWPGEGGARWESWILNRGKPTPFHSHAMDSVIQRFRLTGAKSPSPALLILSFGTEPRESSAPSRKRRALSIRWPFHRMEDCSPAPMQAEPRSEERRVGKECR